MGVLEFNAKSEGFPKMASLGLIITLQKHYRNLEWSRKPEEEEEEGGEAAAGAKLW